LFPGVTLFFLNKYKSRLDTPAFKKRFEALYDSVETAKESCIYLVPFFLFRRLALAACIVFMDSVVCI
jgi:hypothetical protein